MTEEALQKFKKFIIESISELEDSNLYLDEATQPTEPSVAIGRLSRMEAIGEKSVNEARHVNVKLKLEKLKKALRRKSPDDFK